MTWSKSVRELSERLGFGANRVGGWRLSGWRTVWLILLGLVGCLLIIVPGTTTRVQREAATPPPTVVESNPEPGAPFDYSAQVERSLTEVLAEIAGAGTVKVRVYLESGPRFEYAKKTGNTTRTTDEREGGGTQRTVTERVEDEEVTILRNDSARSEAPVVLVRREPEIRGVLVLATGAADPNVREALSVAVQTALGLPAHRVEVLTKEAR